jgi:hypothetical protein
VPLSVTGTVKRLPDPAYLSEIAAIAMNYRPLLPVSMFLAPFARYISDIAGA